MTWLTYWTPPGSPFPAWDRHATEDDAERHALVMARKLGVEVAVIEEDG